MTTSAFGVEHDVAKAQHRASDSKLPRFAPTGLRVPVGKPHEPRHAAVVRRVTKLTKLTKAYQPGAITYHQTQADLHSRKKASGKRQIGAGTTVATLGAAAHGAAPSMGAEVRRLSQQRYGHGAAEAIEHGGKVARAARLGGTGAVVAGAGLAGVGGARVLYHGHQQNQRTRAAQAARKQRNAQVGKAFGGGSIRQAGKVMSDLKGPEFHSYAQNLKVEGMKQDYAAGRRASTRGNHRLGERQARAGSLPGLHRAQPSRRRLVLASTGAAGAGVAAGGGVALAHRNRDVGKALNRDDASEAALGTGSAASGAVSVRMLRRAAEHRTTAHAHNDELTRAQATFFRAARRGVTPSSVTSMGRAADRVEASRGAATAASRAALRATRTGRAGALGAVALGGAAAAQHHRSKVPAKAYSYA